MFKINSVARSSGSSDNFQLTTKVALFGRYKLVNATIPFASNNCITGVNDTICFYENSTQKTATISPGQYTATTLATAVQSALNTASASYNTYAVTYSSTTTKLTITAGNNFQILGSNVLNTAAHLIAFLHTFYYLGNLCYSIRLTFDFLRVWSMIHFS